jgi:hypothetical protein
VTLTIAEELVVKSRHRVKTYGEVFTPRHMVNRMLDLVREELETGPDFVDKTFLEPAAGDGNFLVAILHRKLHAIEKRYPEALWAAESLFAVASIYGIELLEDNHQDAKEVMLAEFERFHTRHGSPCDAKSELRRAASFLIDRNIVRGDMLTGLDWRGEEIQYSWWNRVSDQSGRVHRDPFKFASLRGESFLDFTVYPTYEPCPVERVHVEAKDR